MAALSNYFELRNEIDREFYANQQEEDEDYEDDEAEDQEDSQEKELEQPKDLHQQPPQAFETQHDPRKAFDSAAAGYGYHHGVVQRYDQKVNLPYSTDFVNSSHLQKRLVCVDSRHRDPNSNDAASTTHAFNFTLQTPLKHVVRVKLSSVEIPFSFYDFSDAQGNTQMDVSGAPVKIPEGNYASLQDVLSTLQDSLRTATLDPSATVLLNARTNRVTLSFGSGPMDIDMASGAFSQRETDFGLGYVLGFRQRSYEGVTSVTSEAAAVMPSHPYLYLQVNDWDCVHKQLVDGTVRAFARISNQVQRSAGSMIFDDGQNGVTKEYVFRQPVTLKRLQVRLADKHGEPLDLNGVDMSFALEITQLNHSHVSETYSNMQFSDVPAETP